MSFDVTISEGFAKIRVRTSLNPTRHCAAGGAELRDASKIPTAYLN
jgi:hypothetical protein